MIRLYYLSNTYRATVTEVESLDFIKTENLKEQILELFQKFGYEKANDPEKLYIIAHNTREDIPNTRVKDFYDIYKLFGKNYDEDKFSLYFEAMVMMYGMNLDDINADFLDKEFVKRHEELWTSIKEKYQFVDKDVDLSEAVFFTKAVLSEQIQKIKSGELKKQAYSLVRKKG